MNKGIYIIMALGLLVFGCSNNDRCPVPDLEYSEVDGMLIVGGEIDVSQNLTGVIESLRKELGKVELDNKYSNELSLTVERVESKRAKFSQEYFQKYKALQGQICTCYEIINKKYTPSDKKKQLWESIVQETVNFYKTIADSSISGEGTMEESSEGFCDCSLLDEKIRLYEQKEDDIEDRLSEIEVLLAGPTLTNAERSTIREERRSLSKEQDEIMSETLIDLKSARQSCKTIPCDEIINHY